MNFFHFLFVLAMALVCGWVHYNRPAWENPPQTFAWFCVYLFGWLAWFGVMMALGMLSYPRKRGRRG